MRANAYTLGMFKPTVVSVLLCVVATLAESRPIMSGGVLPACPGNNDKDWVGNATMSPDGSREQAGMACLVVNCLALQR